MNHLEKNSQGLVLLNAAGLTAVSIVLIVAFYYQLAKAELPCPLCLLQRVGLIIAGMGFLFNLTLGLRKSHYALMVIGCTVTGVIAVRQVLLHILPGDTGYGSALFGVHFYTWSLITSVALLGFVALILLLSDRTWKMRRFTGASQLINILSIIFVLLIAANLISTFLECGAGQCADNPTLYELLAK